ncbi:MAG: TonB-dependent receptor domain-containing protein [Candidatus Acidiferrales bacterium]
MSNFSFGMGSGYLRGISRLLLVAILLATPVMLFGQGYFGTVTGDLTDPSGGVLQGARVTLTDQAKGYTFNSTSDNNGRYLFTSVPPGLYTVSAAMKGFQVTKVANIKVNVSENATANIVLNLASAIEEVEVNAQAQNLATEDAVTGQVVNRRFINDLPLVDRYVMELTYLAPGVNDMDDQCHNCGGTNFVSNGSRGASADILMDGASITNFEPNGGVTEATYTPSPEAVEEFKIQQSNFSAEYGFTGASVLNMITRSGSNSFHGSGYDFIRNTITDANNWFNNASNQPIPPVHRHNFGGTIGGPIIKNKTFFFFDYDGVRSADMGTYQAGVPSAAERTGDFGEVCGAYGGTFDSTGLCSVPQGQVYDPYSGVYCSIGAGDPSICPPPNPNNPPPAGAYRGTFIPYNNLATYTSLGNSKLNGTPYQLLNTPGNLIDPVALKMLNMFPTPTPGMANATIYDNWIASGASHGHADQFDVKIDHRFSEKNLLSVKYSQHKDGGTSYNCFGNFMDPCSGGPSIGTAHLFTINDTHSFSPTLVLTTTLGFTRGALHIDAYNKSLNADPLGALGFPSYLQSNGFLGVPAMFIGGGYYSAGYTTAGQDPYGNYRQGKDTSQLSFMLNKISGRHDLKFGWEGRLHQMNYIQTNAPVGYFNFDQYGSSLCPGDVSVCGGDGMASFLMGNINGGGYYEIQFLPAVENYQYAGFAQDNWKVTPKLMLNLGVRYDVSLPRTERHNRMNWFDPNVVSPLPATSLGALHGGDIFASSSQRSNWLTDWKDIQPRFGFAYLVTPKTVIRGGYGIYFGQNRSGANGLLSYGSQGFNQYTSVISTYGNDGATPYLHLSNPFPNGLIQPSGSSLGLMNDVGFDTIGPIRSSTMARTPYEQTWSFGLEHQLPGNLLVSAQYIGKKGTHLYFAGTNHLDILGPQIESYSSTQIAALLTYVDNPLASVITDPNSSLSSSQVQAFQLQLPYPQFTSVTTDVQPIANSTYHALQLQAEKNYSNGLQLSANFTWSKSIDDSSTYDDNVTWLGSFVSLQDPNKPWLERSLSTFDTPAVLKVNYVYELPWGKGRAFLSNMPRVLNTILGGWKTNGVWTISDGRPLSFSMYDGTSLPTYGGQRPNLVGTPIRSGGPESNWINNYFLDPTVFQLPTPYTLGNAPRAIGSVRTPFFFTSNLSMEKDFSLSHAHEGMIFELRLEAQNAFNHPVFGTPNTSVDDPNFGVISYTTVGPRQVQLALKLAF